MLGADNKQSKSKSNSSHWDDDDVDDSQDQNKYQGIVGPDILMSGSGKLKVASIAKAAVGEKLEVMLNIPKPPKPVGLGSPKGMANLGDKGAGNRKAG